MNWFEHFRYDESVPGCLVWVRFAANNRIKPGEVAGKFQPKQKNPERGYFRVFVVDRSYAHHRIIWEMFNRPLEDGEQVDHIDGNTRNNKIENLRVVTNQENSYNQRKRSTNKSGVTGVYVTDNGQGRLYWTACWQENGKRCGCMYSIDKHGYDESFNLANIAREQAIQRIKESGVSITERHGT
jgi:hypothetical protein